MVNEIIIEQFHRLINHIKREIDLNPKNKSNYFRLKTIEFALNLIKNYTGEIKSSVQFKNVKCVGPGILDRIDEIIKTGTLSEIDEAEKVEEGANVDSVVIQELQQVNGIGPVTALKLVEDNNITGVDELKKLVKENKITVTREIHLGLKYYEDSLKRIPREEIEEIDKYLDTVSKKLGIKHVICGSYRRGKAESGDIDVLVTSDTDQLKKFITVLKNDKFIVDDISPDFDMKYMGYCKYDKTVRRIDIRFIQDASFYTALVYFTGDGEFNKKMRRLAIELGYKLSEYGIYKIGSDVSLKISNEHDVFTILGLEYVEPKDRSTKNVE
jgi:DNA polymerase beta